MLSIGPAISKAGEILKLRRELSQESTEYLRGIIDSYTISNKIISIIYFPFGPFAFDERREKYLSAKELIKSRLSNY